MRHIVRGRAGCVEFGSGHYEAGARKDAGEVQRAHPDDDTGHHRHGQNAGIVQRGVSRPALKSDGFCRRVLVLGVNIQVCNG